MVNPKLEIYAERRRKILSLLRQKPMTYPEIAKTMGLTKGIAKSQLYRLVNAGALEKFGPERKPLFRPVAWTMPGAYQVPLDVLASEMAKTGLCGEMK